MKVNNMRKLVLEIFAIIGLDPLPTEIRLKKRLPVVTPDEY